MNPDVAAPCAPALDYLERLNEAQRRAVVFGIGSEPVGPLLVIAGAGTGKTNTLAHRVAHLVAHGADPGRILLLTFSRRAAEEMTRRVARILGQVPPPGHGLRGWRSAWSGTFHSVGARLLREYAGRIGLDAGFTIHDRADSADLMNLVRHELGLFGEGQALSVQGHVPRHLFSGGQYLQRTRRRAAVRLLLVCAVAGRTQAPVRRLRRGQASAVRARL